MRLHITLADAAEKPLRELAEVAGFTGPDFRETLAAWLHHLAGVEQPRHGGSAKGRTLQPTDKGREARRANMAVARAARKSRKPVE